MNQRPQGLKVEKAITGFLHYKSAEALAPVTVSGYELTGYGYRKGLIGCASGDPHFVLVRLILRIE